MFHEMKKRPMGVREQEVFATLSLLGSGWGVSAREVADERGVEVRDVTHMCRQLYRMGYVDLLEAAGEPPLYVPLAIRGQRMR